MASKNKGLHFDGVLGSALRDTQGEVLDIAGADISDMEQGKGIVNVDHGTGFYNLIGRITNAKKIFSEADCSSPRHTYYWHQIKAPYIYGEGYLFDADEHPHAKAAAAILRNIHKTDSPLKMKASVEGAIIARDVKDPRHLLRTKVRGSALTFTPANNATLIEPLGLSKSSYDEASDYALMKSIAHLAKTDIPSFRSITRHASASTVVENLQKIEEMAKSLGIDPSIVVPEIKELMNKAISEKIQSNVESIQAMASLLKARTLDASHPSFTPPKEVRPTYLPRTQASKQRLSETGSTTEMGSGKFTVDPNDAKHNLESVGVEANKANLNATTKAVELHETQHSKNQNIAKQLKNQSGQPIDSDDFSRHVITHAGLDPHELHFLDHFVPAYSGSYSVSDPDETMSVVSEALSGRNTLRAPALQALQEHLPGETQASMTERLKDIHKKLHNTYGQYEAGQKLNVPSDEEYEAHFNNKPKAYLPKVVSDKHLNKALTAGYGAAGRPSDLTGGGVFQTEHVPMGRGISYMTCDNCGNEQVYMPKQTRCRNCKTTIPFDKLARFMLKTRLEK
jgi:hypothetical protein